MGPLRANSGLFGAKPAEPEKERELLNTNASDDAKIKQSTSKILAKLKASENMMNEIFGFFSGAEVVHKLALLNKQVREGLRKIEPFAPERIITLKIKSG
jgi:hypothetical protein